MNALGADKWETLLIYLVSEKLDGETRRDWELQTRVKTLKTYADLKTFIEQRVIAFEAAPMTPSSVANKTPSRSHALVVLNSQLSQTQRNIDFINAMISRNFLSDIEQHSSKQTQSALTFLVVATMRCLAHVNKIAQVLNKSNGRFHKCRALLDSGSQATLNTEACVAKLKMLKSKCSMCTVGVGQSNIAGPQYITSVKIKRSIGATITRPAFILPKVTGPLPNRPFEFTQWKLSKYKVADLSFNQPSECDLIHGMNIWAAFS